MRPKGVSSSIFDYRPKGEGDEREKVMMRGHASIVFVIPANDKNKIRMERISIQKLFTRLMDNIRSVDRSKFNYYVKLIVSIKPISRMV